MNTRKTSMLFSATIMLTALLCAAATASSSPLSITVTGIVRQPLVLGIEEMSNMQQTSLRINDIKSDGTFSGVFNCRGVSLKSLLQLAHAEKESSRYSKPVDTVIRVKSKSGEVLLPYAEVMYAQAADFVLALNAEPVMPMKDCSSCHKSDTYNKWYIPLKRQVGFPKLIIAGDRYSDRSIEDITAIEVIDLHAAKIPDTSPDAPKPFSAECVVSYKGATVKLKDLASFTRAYVDARQVGDGKGFHGIRKFSGSPLYDILCTSGIKPGLNSIIIARSPDGYCSATTYGSIALSKNGRSVIVADMLDGNQIKEFGRFNLVFPDDLSADRWVKALSEIEIIDYAEKPLLYIIGMGCGDTSLLTREAVSSMAKADCFVCTEDLQQRFAYYLAGKPVLFDPLMTRPQFYKKRHPEATDAEISKKTEEISKQNVDAVRQAIRSGKSVGFLEYGDPTIYGSWTYWLMQGFTPSDIRVIPGISAFNAANAMIGGSIAENGFIIGTPESVEQNEAMMKNAASTGTTLVIFTGLRDVKKLSASLEKYYDRDFPAFLIYNAGYSYGSLLVKTTVGGLLAESEKRKGQWLGIIYVGKLLK